jgi:hypothetical protein
VNALGGARSLLASGLLVFAFASLVVLAVELERRSDQFRSVWAIGWLVERLILWPA